MTAHQMMTWSMLTSGIGKAMLEKPEYTKDIDGLKVSLGFCIAITLFLFSVPRDGSTPGRLAAAASSYVGLLTSALLVVFIGRALVRWKRPKSN